MGFGLFFVGYREWISANILLGHDGEATSAHHRTGVVKKRGSLKTLSYKNPVAKLLVTAFFRDK